MPGRRADPQRLAAALSEQRRRLGGSPWDGPVTADALGRGCVTAALCALDAGAEPDALVLRTAVTHLLGLLAARAPGRAVEVRVPPYAAIQCVAGPRHTRGTPGNVVETDPPTWLRLATGQLSWAAAAAAGRLAVSGPRADLSPYLPVAEPGHGGWPASID